MCVFYLHACMCIGARRGQRRAFDTLGLEFAVVVSHCDARKRAWVLGQEQQVF